jgi:hypothetical protein
LQSFMDERHVGFEVNGFNEEPQFGWSARNLAMRMVSGCLWYARSDERSRPQTPG